MVDIQSFLINVFDALLTPFPLDSHAWAFSLHVDVRLDRVRKASEGCHIAAVMEFKYRPRMLALKRTIYSNHLPGVQPIHFINEAQRGRIKWLHQDHTAKSKCKPGSPKWKSHAISASKWTASRVCPCCSGKGRFLVQSHRKAWFSWHCSRTCPTASLVLCSRVCVGRYFPYLPSFFGSISLPCLKTLSSDATESALRLSRRPVTPPAPSCPRYSEFRVLPFGWFLLLLCQSFSFLHLFPLGCALLWHWRQWMMGCHLLKTCTFPWAAPPAMTQWRDHCPGGGGAVGCTVDGGGGGENCSLNAQTSSLCAANHSSAVLLRRASAFLNVPGAVRIPVVPATVKWQRSRAAWRDPESQSSRMASPQGWVPWGVRVSFVWEVLFGSSLKWQRGSSWPIYKAGRCWGRVEMGYKGIGTAVVRLYGQSQEAGRHRSAQWDRMMPNSLGPKWLLPEYWHSVLRSRPGAGV